VELSKEVVVTGWGCVSPLGGNTESTWSRLVAGSAVRAPISCIPVEGCRVVEGAQAELPDLNWLPPKTVSRLSRAARLALPAAREAMVDAGILDSKGRSVFPRLEMSLSTTANGMELGEAFLQGVWAGSFRHQTVRVSRYPAQQQVADLQQSLGFTGPAMIVSNACASGANAIGHAADLVRAGFADIVLAGGFEALCELVFCGFDCLQSLAPDDIRPFDVNRRGLMLGEGAAFLVIESAAHAAARGAKPKGRIVGYGHTTDTHHITQPDPTGAPLELCIRRALEQAGLQPSDVGHINAHGTGTPFNDSAEAAAFARVFIENAKPRLVSTKAAIGHTLGAAGTLEAVFSLLALQTRRIPPQIKTTNPIPEVAGWLAQPGEVLEKPVVLSVNLGFGGSNAALLLSAA
jgi:3-oxoacyl-[acyl-carrier-protein] synthase II